MTLIDTSAWIEYFRPRGVAQVKQRVLDLLLSDAAAYTCPVLYELHLGVKDDERALLEDQLQLCTRLPFAPDSWVVAASCERRLRSQGFTVKRDDIMIAVVALHHRVPLLCRDKHFECIRDVGGLGIRIEQMA